MYQDQWTTTTPNWQIADGMTVYATDGTKLGTVRNYDPATGYLDVRKGWLFTKDFYVPLAAVETVTADGIMLQLTQETLEDERYMSPPAVSDATSSGYATDTTASNASDRTSIGANTEARLEDGEDVRIPVRQEELVAGKRAEEQGRVHIHKDVTEEQQTLDVPVAQERVTVERRPYRDGDGVADDAFVERDVDVPLMGEEVVAEKRIRGVEEVDVHKDVVTEQEQVSGTIRKEAVTVDGVDENGRATAGARTRAAGRAAAEDLRATKDRVTD